MDSHQPDNMIIRAFEVQTQITLPVTTTDNITLDSDSMVMIINGGVYLYRKKIKSGKNKPENVTQTHVLSMVTAEFIICNPLIFKEENLGQLG